MSNWLINLNWKWNIEIWKNCRKNGRAAIGWSGSDESLAEETSFQKAIGYFRKIEPGDHVVAFLKDRRLGGWGVVNKGYDEDTFEPQLAAGTDSADFGRVVHVQWYQEKAPPFGQAARMKPDDVQGFSTRSSVNPLSDEAFDRLRAIIEDANRWEPISELADEHESDDEVTDQYRSPVRESVLREILAADLSKLEPGLAEFDPERGSQEFSIGKAGRMDLFCRDKNGNPVVVEIKKGYASDYTIGQIARYMGYVTENHLKPSQIVRGIIVAHEVDEHLRLAVRAVPNVELRLYEIHIKIRGLEKELR
jgi:hypothetical protein